MSATREQRRQQNETPVGFGRCYQGTLERGEVRVGERENYRCWRCDEKLMLVNRVSQELSATLDVERAAEWLLREVTGTIGAEGASLWLWDEEREGYLACRALFHADQKLSPHALRLAPGEGVAGWTARSGESVVVNRTAEDARFFRGIDEQTGLSTASLIAVPLCVRGEVLGVVEVMNKLGGDFDADDLFLIETLAASTAVAIENAQLVEALRRQAAELEARNEELNAFAHSVAHELRNVLSFVTGYVGVIERDLTTLPLDSVQAYLRVIERNAYKMDQIISDLLLLARVGQEGAEIVPLVVPLDMTAIVAEAQEQVNGLFKADRVECIRPDVWPAAMGYGPWVEQVWINYLSNAIKYGGQPPRVELGARVEPDGIVLFWVRDNGFGLTPKEQAGLFRPFSRLHRGRAQGHGLGLTIVRRIVERLGGEVGVESVLGQGSTFWFTLPGPVEA